MHMIVRVRSTVHVNDSMSVWLCDHSSIIGTFLVSCNYIILPQLILPYPILPYPILPYLILPYCTSYCYTSYRHTSYYYTSYCHTSYFHTSYCHTSYFHTSYCYSSCMYESMTVCINCEWHLSAGKSCVYPFLQQGGSHDPLCH